MHGHMKCKCGREVTIGWESSPRGYHARCSNCGRSGPVIPPGNGSAENERNAWAAWDEDRSAIEEAREALLASNEECGAITKAIKLLGKENNDGGDDG